MREEKYEKVREGRERKGRERGIKEMDGKVGEGKKRMMNYGKIWDW